MYVIVSVSAFDEVAGFLFCLNICVCSRLVDLSVVYRKPIFVVYGRLVLSGTVKVTCARFLVSGVLCTR